MATQIKNSSETMANRESSQLSNNVSLLPFYRANLKKKGICLGDGIQKIVMQLVELEVGDRHE